MARSRLIDGSLSFFVSNSQFSREGLKYPSALIGNAFESKISRDNNFDLNEKPKKLNIYFVQTAKYLTKIPKYLKKYFNYQVKNGNIFDKNTQTFKNIKTY